MLCTLLRPTSGKAIINGFDLIKDRLAVRKSIGLVFQDPSLDERLSALENLKFHAMIYGVTRLEREKRIAEVLELVELEERQHDLVKTFSGGMKRRLELARGLLHRPKVLFLDEPTLGLDPQTRHHIWEYVHQLKAEVGLTIFLTTHYMDEAERLCDTVAIVDHGKIIAQGSPSSLIAEHFQEQAVEFSNSIAADRQKLEALPGVTRMRFDGDKATLYTRDVPRTIASLMELAEGDGGAIGDVVVRRATLEDVFLKLTGRRIREE